MDNNLRINKYLPIALLYFFFNSLFLPHGLLYTTLLTPLFILWLYRYRSYNYLWPFFIITVPFFIIHLLNGLNLLHYLKSYLLLFSVYVFAAAFYQFLINCRKPAELFKIILIFNIIMVGVALIARLIPSLESVFWYENPLTAGVQSFKRLKLLTYEPSYYSLLFVPIALYYYLKMLLFYARDKLPALLMVTIPLLLSLSFGVIMGITLALCLVLLSDLKLFTLNKRLPKYMITIMLLLMLLLIIAILFFPNNILFLRMTNVFKGQDTSFKGRTFDSFYLGWEIASQKSVLFGAGPGQTKLLGLDLFRKFYNFTNFTEQNVGVPNSIGDLLATFGLVGVLLKLGLEGYLFVKTKVYENIYRLSLFLFVLIYQFTGSFITNIAEYVIWVMAFSPWLFTEFNKKILYKDQKNGDNQ